MANVTYTFTAGTKAQAGQVNKNFQDCVNGINQNASEIAQNSSDISSLQSSKANKNGSSSERFSVANPTSQYEAVNKGYLENAITPVLDYMNGLVITKSSNTEIAISAGSCYDSTQSQLLVLSSSYTASYSGTLTASTTYDVFIRKSKSTSSVDCAILAHESEPSSSDYYYRKIGEIKTDSNTYISNVYSYSNTYRYSLSLNYDVANPVNAGSGTHTATQDGFCYYSTNVQDSQWAYLYSGSISIIVTGGSYTSGGSATLPVVKGQTYGGSHGCYFVPLKGE